MATPTFEKITGGLRRWQLLLGFLDMFIAMLTCPAHFAMPYYAPKIDFWCAPPSHLQNVSTDLWRQMSIPQSKALGGPSQCEQFDFSYSNVSADNYEQFVKSAMNSTKEVKSCDSWSYDKSVWKKTIVEDVIYHNLYIIINRTQNVPAQFVPSYEIITIIISVEPCL